MANKDNKDEKNKKIEKKNVKLEEVNNKKKENVKETDLPKQKTKKDKKEEQKRLKEEKKQKEKEKKEKQNKEEVKKQKKQNKGEIKKQQKQNKKEEKQQQKEEKKEKKEAKAEVKRKDNNKIEETENNTSENNQNKDFENYENVSIIDLKTIVLVLFILAVFAMILWNYYSEEIDSKGDVPLAESADIYTDNKINLNARRNSLPNFVVENNVSLINDYLNERSIIFANPKEYLIDYQYTTKEKMDTYEKTADESFIKTDILYDSVKKNFLTYVTQNFFLKDFKEIFKNSNSLTHVANIEKDREIYTITKSEQIQKGGMPIIKIWYKTRIAKRRRIRGKNYASTI